MSEVKTEPVKKKELQLTGIDNRKMNRDYFKLARNVEDHFTNN
jgi:hypothetical protein